MKIDDILDGLPLIGIIFQRSYAFWRRNIAIANITHVALGIGLALTFSGKLIVGSILIGLAVLMHFVAFVVSGK